MSREPKKSEAETTDAVPAPAEPDDGKKGESRRTKHIVAGAAIGIGSAALVAALLYANRARKSDKA